MRSDLSVAHSPVRLLPPESAVVTAPALPPGGGRPLSGARCPTSVLVCPFIAATPSGVSSTASFLRGCPPTAAMPVPFAAWPGDRAGVDPYAHPGGTVPASPPASPDARPLLVTADPLLLDDLLRLCAAAAVEPDVAADVGGARRSWPLAPLVLVGTDLAGALDHRPLARRPGVLLVGRDLDDGGVWELAVRVGAEQVLIVPDGESELVERIAEAVEGGGREALTVCFVGGRGGAGASTLAASLALTATRRGLRCLLVDGDPLGGGIDMVLGGEDAVGLRWPELVSARGRVNGSALRDALPRVNELTVLSWDRGDVLSIPADAMRAVLCAGRRSSDLVVV